MKLGIIGLGRRMNSMFKIMRELCPEVTVAGMIDSNPEAARERLPEEDRSSVKFYDSVADLVEQAKPDALAIGTRCDSHAGYAVEAAKYDLPLFLEKPIAISMDQAISIEKAFEKSRCPVLVSFPLRVSTLCQRTKQLLDQGVVGRIEHILSVNYVAYGNVYFDTWHRDYAVTQGLFLQKATHDLDYLAYLAGAPITRVAAMSSLGRVYRDTTTKGGNPDPNSLYLDQIGTPQTGMNEDSSSALLEFANGAKGVYTQVFFSKRAPKRGATFSGLKGMVEFDWYENNIKTVHHLEPFTDVATVTGKENHFGGDHKLIHNFLAMVRENAPSAAPISTGLESVYACLAAKESAETQRFISVRQLGSC